jgi:hypothetical protein
MRARVCAPLIVRHAPLRHMRLLSVGVRALTMQALTMQALTMQALTMHACKRNVRSCASVKRACACARSTRVDTWSTWSAVCSVFDRRSRRTCHVGVYAVGSRVGERPGAREIWRDLALSFPCRGRGPAPPEGPNLDHNHLPSWKTVSGFHGSLDRGIEHSFHLLRTRVPCGYSG